jgi:NADH:ubiquinone oxidoreductase subunit 5 (subunit L)/multisubunit Na+/H+ antiporter MnhA subunit
MVIDSIDNMFKSMFILAVMSIFIGYSFSDIIIGLGTPIWNNSILILPYHDNLLVFSQLSIFIKDLPLIFTIIGIFYIWSFLKFINKDHIYNNLFIISTNNYSKYILNNILDYYYCLCNIGYNAFFFNNLYNYIFISSYRLFYLVNVKYLDKGLFEYIGPFGLYDLINLF